MGITMLESAHATRPRQSPAPAYYDGFLQMHLPVMATARASRALVTSIRADMGESAAYQEALRRGEIGLQRPCGANVQGVDFVTAARDAHGVMWVYATDVKTTTTGARPPRPRIGLPTEWRNEASAAALRVRLHDLKLAQEIKDAAQHGRIALRQVRVDYSRVSAQGVLPMSGW